MSYPTLDTIKMFVEIINRDGLEQISEDLLLKTKDVRLIPMLSYLKQAITIMLENDLLEEVDGFSTGFITCLDMFRRQIDADNITLNDIELQLQNMCGWIEFLEKENLELKNEINELKR